MPTRLLTAVCSGLLVVSAAPTALPPHPAIPPAVARSPAPAAVIARPSAGATYSAPVGPLRVVRGFVAPASRYGAGHRGVDLAVGVGAPVRAAGSGVVRFAGRVAGRGVVVVQHPDGVSTEYEPLTPSTATGARVARGQPIGMVSGRHGRCAANRCLHWGARRDGTYFDPLLLLRPLGPVRLLPWTQAWP